MSRPFSEFLPEFFQSDGFVLSGTNPGVPGDPNYRPAFSINATEDSTTLNPTFTTFAAAAISVTSTHGHNAATPGVGQQKFTFIPLSLYADHFGAGQKVNFYNRQNSYSMGDCALMNLGLYYAGGPISGDEGTCFGHVSYIQQLSNLQLGTITTVMPRSGIGISTTIPGAITASKDPQTVTVTSTTGGLVDDWIVVGQEIPSGSPSLEAVKIIALTSTTITGIFRNTHLPGAVIKPALLLDISGAHGSFGQDRVIVNLGGASYSTGTVTTTSVPADENQFTGSGTGWSNGMVGGDTLNVGAISLNNDTYTGFTFASTPLRSWYQITQITDATHLRVHSYAVGGSSSYKGNGPGGSPSAGNYIVRPAARMLWRQGTLCICEWSAATWSAGHQVECAICPYPTVVGFMYNLAQWTPNGRNNEGFLFVRNAGARKFGIGISITDYPMQAGGDNVAWGTGIHLRCCEVGMQIDRNVGQPMTCAIMLQPAEDFGPGVMPDDNATKIDFRNGHLMADSTIHGMKLQGTRSGGGTEGTGTLTFRSGNDVAVEPDSRAVMAFMGSLRLNACMELNLIGATVAAVSNRVRLYLGTSGAKQALYAQFKTGAPVQVAIEP